MTFFKRHPRSAAVLIVLAAVILCAIVVLALCLPRDRDARVCADVTERDWFCPALRHLAAAGLLDIDTKTPFSPTERLTRAAAVTLLHRLAGAPDEVRAELETVNGRITSERKGGALRITVPANTRCTVRFGGAVKTVGSGSYEFNA